MINLILIVVLAYVLVVGALYLGQGRIIFPGSLLPSRPATGPLVPERLTLGTEDGAQLHGLLFRASEQARDLMIGFGGNAQDAGVLAHELAARFPGAHVSVFHYRGYAPSTGQPGEIAVLGDALRIHDYLSGRLQPERIFAIGVSLGSAVAAYLSRERRLNGIILVTPFDSIEAIARQNYFWAPVSLLLKHRFPSVEFMAENRTPVAVIAAEHDRTVRPERTQALLDVLDNLVFQTTIDEAAHNTIGTFEAYDDALEEAFEALIKDPAASKPLSGGPRPAH